MDDFTWEEIMEECPDTAPRIEGYLKREYNLEAPDVFSEAGWEIFSAPLECTDNEARMFELIDQIVSDLNRCKRDNRKKFYTRIM